MQGMTIEQWLWVLVCLAVVSIIGLLIALFRRVTPTADLRPDLEQIRSDLERNERGLREEWREGQRIAREEQAATLMRLETALRQQLDTAAQTQQQRTDGMAQRLDQFTQRTDLRLEGLRQSLTEDARRGREESAETLKRFGDSLDQRVLSLTQQNDQRLIEVRATLEARLKDIQADSAAKLDQMRATVDEKLQRTLETRLGESFKQVSERLEQVHRGLGEMQTLAQGVGDLKRVLGNVKTRGTYGEVQLGALLEQVLTSEQYAANVATVPGSNERVEFALRLPGHTPESPVWLPIDAKFPREDYERLLDAQERADPEAAAIAGKALEVRVREEARRIRDKYIAPPHTTDFGLLFLPTEGLYAEVIRRPGLFELLQRDFRITLAGPTTLSALLNSLQMGFRTLAIEKRSSEVWQLLGAVKNEFGKFGEVLDKTQKQLDTVSKSIGQAGIRTRAIERKLRDVEVLPGTPALGLESFDADADNEDDRA